jgi:hypothetical protein
MRYLFILPLAAALTGCAVPTLYQWGGYDQALYSGYKDPTQMESMRVKLVAKLFGADAVLYVSIGGTRTFVITTTVTVEFDYRLVSKDGTELWKENKQMQYSPQNNNSGGGAA